MRIAEADAPLREAAAELRTLRDEISILEPGKSLDAVQTRARRMAEKASNAIWERIQAFLAFVLILMVELLLLPFLSAYLIYKGIALAFGGMDARTGEANAPLVARSAPESPPSP